MSLDPVRKTRVLVVEDNRDLAQLFRDLLDVLNCDTALAFNVNSALESAQNTPPDIIFCDIRLPGDKNGFDFAREFRADPRFAKVPLIAVTGNVDPDDYERALRCGFNQVLTKPFKFADIQKLLAECTVQ